MPAGPWQPWVDENLVGTGMCSGGLIMSTEGAIYAYTAGWPITQAECKVIAAAIAAGDATSLQAGGIRLAGQKFFCLRVDEDENENIVVFGKLGDSGLCVSYSGATIVVGAYSEGMTPTGCNVATMAVTEYLFECGV
eukprot:TRINITY_DN28411_c0_g1_i1.p2 TRINITY_DN28411_c0_g1~~TRINITY_DN28411_c0_g1_i1.p2  ORF type:complete len:137 (+),score=40.50 TRINITY_DN28411_c0_g1_i1:55-465(+)